MKRILLTITALLALSAATNAQNYKKGDPSNSNCKYLDDYLDLKKYIDRTKYPNFKLGIGTTVSEYLKKSTVYNCTNANFDETVAGNAMKMASCVDNNGNMNFGTVTNYVNTATSAGLVVYGHTLAWHSQQPNGWLRGLIKDKPAEPIANPDTIIITVVGSKDFRTQQNIGWNSDFNQYNYSVAFDATNGMKTTVTKKASQNYEVQYWPMNDIPLAKGKKYKMVMTIKGSVAGSTYVRIGDWNGGPNKTISFTNDWKDIEWEFSNTVENPGVLLQHGSFVGTLYIKEIKFVESIGAKKIIEPNKFLKVEATKKVSDAWDNQFWVVCPSSFAQGAKYVFTARVRADKPATASTQIHNDPGSYVDQAFGNINFTTEWNTIKVEGSFSKAGKSIAFNLNELADANTYYFDDISLKVSGVEKIKNGDIEGTDLSSFKMKKDRGSVVAPATDKEEFHLEVPKSTPRTMEEKREILQGAMEKWIKGMMQACNGKVKAWDVVNEAISGGGNDGSGNYTLQHSDGFNGNATWDVGGDAFYWQDHMGDLDYVRSAVRYARKYGPSDVKLFINDYNLESDWDNNKKLSSLINWIKKWEADGETKIDGIGTQMHISYYENSGTQSSKKNAITRMFQMMANSGKLVRVSEMDMGYVNSSGTTLATSSLTDTQHKNMANFYEWIIKEYLRIIPPAQQWGICQWCPTDAPGNLTDKGGWRNGQPVGIWTTSYYRKHAYAGFVRGLGGQVYTSIEAPTVNEEEKPTEVYDLQGRKVKNPSRGIYVINGKKVVIK